MVQTPRLHVRALGDGALAWAAQEPHRVDDDDEHGRFVDEHPDGHRDAADEHAREHLTAHARDGEAITVATNDEAAALNERIRTGRV